MYRKNLGILMKHYYLFPCAIAQCILCASSVSTMTPLFFGV